ncbi:MNIO family bufferin maturase [Hyphococcus sp.]|uniref:MNIO family bufferin maturase n=1 Tax=Hyphococcus sp. TaxID=2038636 RepID=UPI00208A7EF8|nr:MAG: UPF0276 protein [Marinicaulis sp.]
MTTEALPLAVNAVGVGLKAPHYQQALQEPHEIDFFEVHAENFMGDGGPPHRWLTGFQSKFPLSIHGVCLSIGGRDELDRVHLDRLAHLVERYRPALVSEHLAWSSDSGIFYNDLLPPPMTTTSLERVCAHVNQVQDRLGRHILIENPSLYLKPDDDGMKESDFLNELAQQTQCGLLLDINNIYVSAHNLEYSAEEYIDSIDAGFVQEIHLAGHAIDRFEHIEILVDNHGSPVCDAVMALFARFISRAGPRPTLVEWDSNVPPFETLRREATAAKATLCSIASNGGACDEK